MTGTFSSRHTLEKLIPLIAPAFVVAFGEVAVRLRWVPTSQFPAPSAIIPAICSWPLLQDLGWTCLRVASGVLLGTTIGICTGLYLSQNKPADRMFSLTVRFLAPIPIIIWLPFLVIFLGIGEATKIAFVATGAFFLVHVHCYHSAKEVDRLFTELASIYEKGLLARLWHVVAPASTGAIFTAVRLSIALGWVVVAFSEYNMQETGRGGIGMYILQTSSLGKIEEKFAGMAILGISGALIDYGLVLLERHVRNWANDSGHTI